MSDVASAGKGFDDLLAANRAYADSFTWPASTASPAPAWRS